MGVLPEKSSRVLALVVGCLLLSNRLHAQQAVGADIPDAPKPETVVVAGGGATPSTHTDPQTKRILGIFPNFRAVSAEAHLPPQSVQEKFETASQDSFDYSALMLPAGLAGYSELTNATPEFHSGWPGYGRYFWHTWVDQTSENYLVEFIVPALTREDTRYYTMGPGGGRKLKRIGYALSRAVVTRNDAGKDTFNVSEVVGAGVAAGISNFYYPRPERTFAKTADKWSVNVGVDAASFMIREFWPDINHYLFHGNVPMANH
jgi:hypothetical protein